MGIGGSMMSCKINRRDIFTPHSGCPEERMEVGKGREE